MSRTAGDKNTQHYHTYMHLLTTLFYCLCHRHCYNGFKGDCASSPLAKEQVGMSNTSLATPFHPKSWKIACFVSFWLGSVTAILL
jgi:hypothetical protein